jgi:aminocarboxymuconate-semialdehyde decarboxylase
MTASQDSEKLLVHDCGGTPRRSARREKGDIARDYTVDMHCHVLNLDVEKLVAGCPKKASELEEQVRNSGSLSAEHNRKLFATSYLPKLTDIAARVADMDAMGVNLQVVSPSPNQYYYWTDADLSEEVVRITNENLAEIVANDPDRFLALGTVSLQEPQLAAEQAEEAVRKLGLKGIEISTIINETDASDRRFEPFWKKMNELGAVVFMHPHTNTLGPRLSQHYLSNIVGQPAETAITLSKMIFDGLFDRHEGIKLCASHGGGYLPLSISRSDHGYSVRPESCACQLKPSEYLKRIWFDTVIYDPVHLKRLIEQVGIGQIVIGTDYPFDMGHYTPHDLVEAVEGLSADDRRRIFGGNAVELLGLDARPAGERAA